jgi:DNA-binding transcriptional LysR family regulator
MINLRSIDLNLLVTLDVLLAEHNVTRAAKRLHFSQPSISVHLARLREIFGDPLLLPGRAACSRPPEPKRCANPCGWRWQRSSMQ